MSLSVAPASPSSSSPSSPPNPAPPPTTKPPWWQSVKKFLPTGQQVFAALVVIALLAVLGKLAWDLSTMPPEDITAAWMGTYLLAIIVILVTGAVLPSWPEFRVALGLIALLTILGAWVWLVSSNLDADVKNAWIRAGILVILAIPAVGVFLLTYFAYRNNQEPVQKDRVKDDFFFLGLADEADLEQVVDKLFLNVYSPVQFLTYAVLISLLTLVMGMAYLIHTTSPLAAFALGSGGTAYINLPGSNQEVNMIFAAFLGAYLFSIQELVRRYNTFDLLPQVYSSIFVRMIVATGVVGVAAAFIDLNDNSDAAPIAYIIAFLIGSFPQRGIDWLWEKSSDVFLPRQRPATTRPLDTIIGISSWHEARLLEMGIDDAQNLATVDIRKLLLTTQFDTQAIVNWIDQSILYVKVGEKIDALRGIQLLTFTELHNAISNSLVPTVDEHDAAAGGSNETKEAFIAGLLRLLGLADQGELLRLKEASNYPNFYHITEYYDRSVDAVKRRADAGSKALFNSDLPLLSMHFELDTSEGNQSEDELQKLIYTVEQRLSRKPKESRLWQTLGTYKQQLAKQQAKRLAEMPANPAPASDEETARTNLQTQLQKTVEETRTAFDKAVLYGEDDKVAYIRRAAFRLTSNNEGAIEDCARAIMLDPGLAAAYNYRGIAHYNRGYNDLALDDFSRALAIDDRMADAYLNRGTLYNSTAQFDLAQADLQRAYLCTRNNPSPTLLATWGKSLYGQGAWQAAIGKLTEAITLDPKSAVPYVDRGYAYFKDSKYREAENDSLNAIRLDPAAYFAYETLGRTYLKLQRYRDAIGPFEKASELAPDVATGNQSRLSLGYSHLKLGEYAEAIGAYERILQDDPSFNDAHIQVALAYQGVNDPTKAKAHLQWVIDNNPKGSPAVNQALYRLNEGVGQPSSPRPLPNGTPQPVIPQPVAPQPPQPGQNGGQPAVPVNGQVGTPVPLNGPQGGQGGGPNP